MTVAVRARRRAPGRYGYLSLPGVTGNYATSPNSAATTVTGDIDIRCKIAMTDWTPALYGVFVGKYIGGAGLRGYHFGINAPGTLGFNASSTGASADIVANSLVATGITDGSVKWVRVTRAVSTGVVKFYTSDDGTSWTQLDGDVATAATGIYAGTAGVTVGAYQGTGINPVAGKVYRAQIRNNIADDGTGIVFDADFTATGRSFVESSSNKAVVTINGTGSRASIHP